MKNIHDHARNILIYSVIITQPGMTPIYHYENLPMQCTEIFSPVKTETFVRKKNDIFLIYSVVTITQPSMTPINLPMQFTEIFSPAKIEKFRQQKNDIFLIFAQNIGCG